MKKALLTFLFCMIGFSSFGQELLNCTSRTASIGEDLQVIGSRELMNTAILIDLEKREVRISDDNDKTLYRIVHFDDRIIEAESCDNFEKINCGWLKMNSGNDISKYVFLYDRHTKFGVEQLFYSKKFFPQQLTRLNCN